MILKSIVVTSVFIATFLLSLNLQAQVPNPSIKDDTATSTNPSPAEPNPTSPVEAVKQKHWYEKIGFRGYGQLRYNRIGNPNAQLLSAQGDRSIGGTNNLFIRRARLIFSGDVADNLYIYIQPDLSVAPDNSQAGNFAQLRDYYADISLDTDKEHRFRVGQSKVPYGFENMQSSQNRLALDRNDALNSAARDERDLGVFYYWAPKEIRERFKYLVDSGLKGSGDYGVFAFGAYNGQTANRPEANKDMHYVARATYPFKLESGQFIEASVQAYSGYFTVGTSAVGTAGNPLAVVLPAANRFRDQRAALSFVYYPQPFGFQAEYNIGEGPELNDAKNAVETKSLHGGYAQVMYQIKRFMPFVRVQTYRGGRKHENFSPSQKTDETEVGVEWQANKAIELTGMYTWTDRTSSASPYNNYSGNLARLQLQWNY